MHALKKTWLAMMSKRLLTVLMIGTCMISLAACESARKVVSNTKDAPDEFVIYERPPLSLPPEFALRPPEPGALGPQGVSPTDQARSALLNQSSSVKQAATIDPNLSDGLNALMNLTGANSADPSIRQVVNAETTLLAKEDKRLADKMIFWVDDKPFEGTVVDAEKEQSRIRENQALGKPITEGETPQIKKKRGSKGLLDF
jgi:hypothetical protein